MANKQQPPKWANRLLHWYCNPEMLEDLEGSLLEYYYERKERSGILRAKWFYWMDVLSHFRPHTWKKRKGLNSSIMLGNHIKVSYRSIRKNILNTSLNSIGLATGLASYILIMLWINQEMAFDQFHEKKDRIYRISNTFKSEAETFSQAPSGPALGAQLHKIFSEVENGVRFFSMSLQMKVGDEIFFERNVGVCDPSIFEIFTFPLIKGNAGTALDDPFSIVLTEQFAKKYYGNEDPIGKTLEIGDGAIMKVVAVMEDVPENSQLQFGSLISMETVKRIWDMEDFDESWGGGWFQTYLLLHDGVDIAQLEQDITAFIREKLASWAEQGMYYEYFLQPLTSIHLNSDLRYDYPNGSLQNVNIFRIVAFVVLLLACINYINITTANSVNRAREVGIRKVIGSSRKMIISQFLVESALIMLVSTVAAIGVAYLLLPTVRELTDYSGLKLFTAENIISTAIIIIITALVSGVFPAMVISGFKSMVVIRGSAGSSAKYGIFRKVLVIFQFTATVILLISMLVINDQMKFVRDQSLGMKTSQVMHINFREIQEVVRNAEILRNELLSLPEIEQVSFLNNSYPVNGLNNSGADVETSDGSFIRSSIYTLRVDPYFAETFGLELVAGRFFSEDFPADSTQSILVNEACVENFGWGSVENAIGKRFGREPNQRQVIGVVRNFNFEALHKKVEPVRILPTPKSRYSTLALKFNTRDPVKVISKIQSVWDSIIPAVPLDISMMSDDIKRQYTAEYNFRTVFTIFSILSIIIGCLGLLGLVTAALNQRIKELSIRKVLGASALQILALINRHFIRLIVISMILASPVAFVLMGNWLQNFSYHIEFSWLYILYVFLGTLFITVITISANAIKTALTNPAEVLKDE